MTSPVIPQQPSPVEERAYHYIRSKVDQLLDTIGTLPLNPDELDNEALISLDPIGIVSESFKHILAHLEETNQRLTLAHDEIHAILNAVGAAIMVVDPTGRIVAGNNKVNEFFNPGGLPLIGSFCHEIVCHEKDSPPVCVLQNVLANDQVEQRNEVTLNGRCYEVIGTAIHDHKNKQLTHVIILYSDITARISNEQALRQALETTNETKERIKAIFSASGDGLLVTDLDGRIALMNHAAAELLRIPLTSQGKTLDQLFDHRNRLWPACLELIDSGKTLGSVDISIGTDKDETVLATKISLLPRSTPQSGGTVIALRDVTRERTIERMKSEFVSTAAHEFRTPLTAIIGFSELMLNDEFPRDEQHEFLTMIHDKAQSLSHLVNNLLDISRIEAGEKLSLKKTPTALQFLLDRTIPGFAKSSTQHQFVTELADDPILDVDAEAIIQVLENILGNAVKYSPAGGTIRIVCTGDKDQCQIAVHDQGIGMTEEQVARVFDKFYRGSALHTSIGGTGLGMTIVKHFIEEHGGEINISSKPGIGTCVCFTLPVTRETSC
ncbi:MAG: PAS domain-containing sensor histidine kinase [Desulfuromonadales bacterium]|nr:PAS domain-containing sensor histidine kinase [Desulfuromonadales bacterium]